MKHSHLTELLSSNDTDWRAVYSRIRGEWYAVPPTSRDWLQGLSKEVFDSLTEEEAKERFLHPLYLEQVDSVTGVNLYPDPDAKV